MKHFALLLISFFVCLISFEQRIDTTKLYPSSTYGERKKILKIDSALMVPIGGDTISKVPGQLKVINNSLYFIGVAGIWKQTNITGSNGNPDTLHNQPYLYYLNYNNLINKPTIPTNTNQLTNGSGFITNAATSTTTAITINYGSTSTWDMSIGKIGYITLAGNTTLTVINPTSNTYYEFEVTQDATGSRTITWPTTFKWSSGTAPTLTTTANAKDVITCSYNGTIFKCNFTPDYR